MTTTTNTTGGLWLNTSWAGELAGLLDGLLEWLCDAEPAALADLEAHLVRHGIDHGGIFAAEEFANGTESIAATFTWMIDAYHTILELGYDDRETGDVDPARR